MYDTKKSAEAVRKIQEIQRTIASHESNIARIEREKSDRIRYFDQQLRQEQDQIKRYAREIEELKRQV